MISNKLIEELHRMNRVDKLRVIRLLADDLAAEEAVGLMPDAAYEIVTPYGNEAAAQVLRDFLSQRTQRRIQGSLNP